MSDPILLLLTVDVVALLLVGASAVVTPPAVCGFLTTMLCGLGALLCLPPLVSGVPATALDVGIGPPGFSLHLALDPLSAFFLVVVLVAGTGVAAFQATSVGLPRSAGVTAVCVAGAVLALVAADGSSLAIGLAVMCGAVWQQGANPRMLVPGLILAAVCVLTPAGYAPRFDAIRAAPIDPGQAAAAVVLAVIAAGLLAWPHAAERCRTGDGLVAGVLVPAGSYLLLRIVADLCGAAPQAWWGFVLVLAGGFGAVLQGWRSAAAADIDGAVAALIRRQASLAAVAVGLALIARAADLAGAATFALQAVCLTTIGGCLGGTALSLGAHVIGENAGTFRLSRLGGLVHTMPRTSIALSAGLLALSALPPSVGFAGLWLSFQSILLGPRTGGLLSQLPLGLTAAALALSAALGTAASARIVGIAVLGRPRTPRGAGAMEATVPVRTVLLTLAGVAVVAGVLPGPVLWLLADPAIHAVTGLPSGHLAELASLSGSRAPAGYLALPVLALLGLATGVVALIRRRPGAEGKPTGPWTDGMEPPVGLPFGEPGAQSAGAGFLPGLPDVRPGRWGLGLKRLVAWGGTAAVGEGLARPAGSEAADGRVEAGLRVPVGAGGSVRPGAGASGLVGVNVAALVGGGLAPATVGLWLVLAAFAVLLLALAIAA